jgi:hypothetical protein
MSRLVPAGGIGQSGPDFRAKIADRATKLTEKMKFAFIYAQPDTCFYPLGKVGCRKNTLLELIPFFTK